MILIASAKTLNEKAFFQGKSTFFNKQKTTFLKENIKQYSQQHLSEKMKIKNKTLETTYDFFHTPKTFTAIKGYNGGVFKQLSEKNLNNDTFLKDNVYIIDAYYGVINSNDTIETYRLDFTMSNLFDINLYSYWQNDVTSYIAESPFKQILFLTSNEFTKLISLKSLDKDLFFLDFSQINYGSYELKKIRGMILNHCITFEIKDYRKLHNQQIGNYQLELNDGTFKIFEM